MGNHFRAKWGRGSIPLQSLPNMKKKPTRGGSRKGAGRKPRDTPREAITVRMEPHDAAKLRDLCKTSGLSQSGWITAKINESQITS